MFGKNHQFPCTQNFHDSFVRKGSLRVPILVTSLIAAVTFAGTNAESADEMVPQKKRIEFRGFPFQQGPNGEIILKGDVPIFNVDKLLPEEPTQLDWYMERFELKKKTLSEVCEKIRLILHDGNPIPDEIAVRNLAQKIELFQRQLNCIETLLSKGNTGLSSSDFDFLLSQGFAPHDLNATKLQQIKNATIESLVRIGSQKQAVEDARKVIFDMMDVLSSCEMCIEKIDAFNPMIADVLYGKYYLLLLEENDKLYQLVQAILFPDRAQKPLSLGYVDLQNTAHVIWNEIFPTLRFRTEVIKKRLRPEENTQN